MQSPMDSKTSELARSNETLPWSSLEEINSRKPSESWEKLKIWNGSYTVRRALTLRRHRRLSAPWWSSQETHKKRVSTWWLLMTSSNKEVCSNNWKRQSRSWRCYSKQPSRLHRCSSKMSCKKKLRMKTMRWPEITRCQTMMSHSQKQRSLWFCQTRKQEKLRKWRKYPQRRHRRTTSWSDILEET